MRAGQHRQVAPGVCPSRPWLLSWRRAAWRQRADGGMADEIQALHRQRLKGVHQCFKEGSESGEDAMEVVGEDRQTGLVCRLIRGLKAQQADLRSTVDRRSITLRRKGKLLEALQKELVPEEAMIRQYLKTVYETDRDLVETLEVARQQLTAMDKAVERPVVVGEALRYARVVRPMTAAPTGWDVRIPWIPRDPFKPSNLCIAASRLRKYQTEIEEKKRERERRAKLGEVPAAAAASEGAGEEEEGEEGAAPSLSREATAELIRHISHSTEFEPPPDWKPGQPIALKPDVVARIRSQVEEEEEQIRKRSMSVASESELLGKEEEQQRKPVAPPAAPAQPPVAKKPKKMTFMDDDDEDDEEDEDD